ncbi:MAG: hypothetical protein QME94_08020 [Anaerolineae bacterium]|nr:hypothetical protein [Anaerolineae bacterium]
MRTLRAGALIVLLIALLACTRAPNSPGPGAQPSPTPSATAETSATAPAPAPTDSIATPAGAWAEGPLAVEGEYLRTIAIAPGSAVRYGVLGTGLARSDDGGQSWRRVSDLSVPTPLVSPRDALVLYAGDIPSCYRDEESPVFRRSTDGGKTWQELPAGQGIRPVAFKPGDPSTLYGISCWALNVSRDGGETWQETGPTQGWDITAILPGGSGRPLFLAVLTSEGGTSHLAWFDGDGKLVQNLTEGLNFWGLGVLATDGMTLYLADSTGVRRSTDGGQHWTLFKDGLDDVTLDVDPQTEGIPEEDVMRGYGLFALLTDPAQPQRLVLGTVRGLYLSEDRGEHWSPAGIEALAGMRIAALNWEPQQPGVLYATTEAGVYVVHLPDADTA